RHAEQQALWRDRRTESLGSVPTQTTIAHPADRSRTEASKSAVRSFALRRDTINRFVQPIIRFNRMIGEHGHEFLILQRTRGFHLAKRIEKRLGVVEEDCLAGIETNHHTHQRRSLGGLPCPWSREFIVESLNKRSFRWRRRCGR